MVQIICKEKATQATADNFNTSIKLRSLTLPPYQRIACVLIAPLCEYSETILSLSQTEIPPSPGLTHTNNMQLNDMFCWNQRRMV